MSMRRRTDRIVNVVAVATFCVLLFPFYWMIASSLKGPGDLLSIPPAFVPAHLSLHFYRQLFGALRLDTFFRNSVVLSVGTAVVTVILASLGAYGVLAYRFAMRTAAARLILFVYMFPPILVVIPLYLLLSRVKLINSHPGLLLTYVAFNLPVAIWVLRAYFSSIPWELVEAGEVDGLSRLDALRRIIVPLSLPGLAAASIFAFIGAWNEFLFANTFLISEHLKTLSVIIVDFNTREGTLRGEILASSVVIAIPSFLFALFAQRYLISGLTAGATKA
jgi:ABC-type glycerol-3-phosphate transport system permease component